MIPYEQIQEVHLELSTLCNAVCPECPRNFHGYTYNAGYPETNMSLEMAEKIFQPEFLKQLHKIHINGNFGDFLMNPQSLEILGYFRSQNPRLRITISTNGGGRNRAFWQELASIATNVSFCIDGLEDTHHLYRQNTVWRTVVNNAESFIAAGGRATWKMIRFKHNEAQIEECLQMSKDKGFSDFHLIDHGRNTGPVYDKNGNLTHILGNYTGDTDIKILLPAVMCQTGDKRNHNLPVPGPLDCESRKLRQIYVDATGDVYPCCYLGFYPRTYGLGSWIGPTNEILSNWLTKNNAAEHGLREAMEWFSEVEKSWSKPNSKEGRLGVCDHQCGKPFKFDRSLYAQKQ